MTNIKVGVVPAAGQGTRMGYLSSILPKCLFPLYDKPIIHHVLENMRSIGVEAVHILVNYQKDKVMEYFKRTQDNLDMEIDFLEQKELLGIAHAIMLTKDYVHEPFMVMLGDDCTVTRGFSNLVNTFSRTAAVALEAVIPEDDEAILSSTCCVKIGNDRRIIEIIEKPKVLISNLRGCGVYLFKSSIYDYIENTPFSPIRKEKEITHVIDRVASAGQAYAEFIDGLNININSYTDLLKASILISQLKNGISCLKKMPMKTNLAAPQF